MQGEQKDDYEHCLNKGKRFEADFARLVQDIGWGVTRNDEENLSNMDFMLHIPVDVKFRGVPFRCAKRFTGLEPNEALPINVNKLNKYKNGVILFVVDYRPQQPTYGLFAISINKIFAILRSNPGRVHAYQDRKTDTKNARESFYVSTNECVRLPEQWFRFFN